MAVAFVQCFSIKVDGILLSLLQLYPLGLSLSWHHHGLADELFGPALKNSSVFELLSDDLSLLSSSDEADLWHRQRSFDMVWHSIDENWIWDIDPCYSFFFELHQTSTMWSFYLYCISNSLNSKICVQVVVQHWYPLCRLGSYI